MVAVPVFELLDPPAPRLVTDFCRGQAARAGFEL